MKVAKVSYPWSSILAALLLLFTLLWVNNSSFAPYYSVPEILTDSRYQLLALPLLLLVVLLDTRYFYRKRREQSKVIERYQLQSEELLFAKKQLQTKAHVYAGHAEKLKLFISDRLLDYIQYDEKFLHFKNIAAEVRHNGVICFDKINTALTEAIEMDGDPTKYNEALLAMRYLWDLLDLSTADNIALHIADHICDCEEQYYQSLLQEDSADHFPFFPIFTPHQTVLRAFAPLCEHRHILEQRVQDSEATIQYMDNNIYLSLDTSGTLLGKENHFLLIVENLLSNASFYANKRQYKHKSSPISVKLTTSEDWIALSIYNRGPLIADVDKERIFQLGYSTRRSKDNHGKGLGLYFVKQIVQGYEGKIQFENHSNREETYVVRMALANGDIVMEVINCVLDGDTIQVKLARDNLSQKKIAWKFSQALKNIEITLQSDGSTYTLEQFDHDKTVWKDPQNPSVATWIITINRTKGSTQVIFMPLDITGVQFDVYLPTVEARLEYNDSLPKVLDEEEFGQMKGKFKTIEDGN